MHTFHRKRMIQVERSAKEVATEEEIINIKILPFHSKIVTSGKLPFFVTYKQKRFVIEEKIGFVVEAHSARK